jgi:hypothetical protein
MRKASEASPLPARARVAVATRPMWRLRLMGAMRRRLLRVLAMAAVLTAVHFAADIKQQHRAPHTPTAIEQRR